MSTPYPEIHDSDPYVVADERIGGKAAGRQRGACRMTISLHLHDCREKGRERAEIEAATERFLAAKRRVTEVPPVARNNYAHTALVLPGSIDHDKSRKGWGNKK